MDLTVPEKRHEITPSDYFLLMCLWLIDLCWRIWPTHGITDCAEMANKYEIQYFPFLHFYKKATYSTYYACSLSIILTSTYYFPTYASSDDSMIWKSYRMIWNYFSPLKWLLSRLYLSHLPMFFPDAFITSYKTKWLACYATYWWSLSLWLALNMKNYSKKFMIEDRFIKWFLTSYVEWLFSAHNCKIKNIPVQIFGRCFATF